MRMIFRLLLGFGMMAVVAAPAFACNYNVDAANDQAAQQHTAQAQPSTETQSN
jgi:hypothetical protein